MDRTENRFGVIWRRSEWRCEYAAATERFGGTLRLYMGSAVVAELEVQSIGELLRVSGSWRELILEGPRTEDAVPAVGLRLMPDRRQPPGNRRAVQRGGRRECDPR